MGYEWIRVLALRASYLVLCSLTNDFDAPGSRFGEKRKGQSATGPWTILASGLCAPSPPRQLLPATAPPGSLPLGSWPLWAGGAEIRYAPLCPGMSDFLFSVPVIRAINLSEYAQGDSLTQSRKDAKNKSEPSGLGVVSV